MLAEGRHRDLDVEECGADAKAVFATVGRGGASGVGALAFGRPKQVAPPMESMTRIPRLVK